MPAMTEIKHVRPQAWILAIRPKTLPAAAAPVIIGAALAYHHGSFDGSITLACLLVALFLQIGSNLANDVYDYEKGADAGVRLGPTRVTQAGLLAPQDVKRGMWVAFGLAALFGLTLVFRGGWPILILGVAAILSAIVYTGGPFPLGYHGLGDLFVFIFFGLVATAGTFYIQTGGVSLDVWAMAAAVGFLTVNILVVNNIRDRESDLRVGKKTLAVRLGAKGALVEYILLMSLAYMVPVLLWGGGWLPVGALGALLSLPRAIHWANFLRKNSGKALNKALAGTSQVELAYALSFAIGLIFSHIAI